MDSNDKFRRILLKYSLLAMGGSILSFPLSKMDGKAESDEIELESDSSILLRGGTPKPTPAQLKWQNAELAALVCWDLHVFDREVYRQGKARITPIGNYNGFNPQKYDTDQWIQILRDAGFRIAIFTVSHETGFFFYQSDVTPYCMKALKWRDGLGDVLKDFKDSCEKYDILPGVYIGTRWNSFFGVYDFKVQGKGAFADNRQEYFNKMVEGIVKEIFTRYGDWSIVWFDGGAYGPDQGGPDILPIFEKHQPDCLFYHNLQRADMRWGGSETGSVPYPCWGNFPYPFIGSGESSREEIRANNFDLLKTGDPDGDYFIPAMSDTPLRSYNGHDWFWEPGHEHNILPLHELIDRYYNSVGHNTTLILGITPDINGQIPMPDAIRLREFGAELRSRFSDPITEVSGRGNLIVLPIMEHHNVNQIVLEEDISFGERVRAFVLEGQTSLGWELIFRGSCIGHKFIHQWKGKEYTALRLKIDRTTDMPIIKRMAAYRVDYLQSK